MSGVSVDTLKEGKYILGLSAFEPFIQVVD